MGDKKNTYDGWIEAFTIFAKYENRINIAVGHDVIFTGPRREKVSQEDFDKLEELGWHWDDDEEGFYRWV